MADEFAFSVDSDWKKQAQEEKRKLAEEAQRQSAAAAPAAGAAPTAPASQPAGRRRGARAPREASFSTLVQTLAGQVMMYLGGVAVQDGQGMVDLDTAKHQIDLLAVLGDKTQGNLTPEEQSALDVALYESRMRFVNVASRYIL